MAACGGNLIGCEISRNKRSAHEGTNLGRPSVAEISSEVRSTEREQAPHEAELRPLRLRRVAPIEAADLGETALSATRLEARGAATAKKWRIGSMGKRRSRRRPCEETPKMGFPQTPFRERLYGIFGYGYESAIAPRRSNEQSTVIFEILAQVSDDGAQRQAYLCADYQAISVGAAISRP